MAHERGSTQPNGIAHGPVNIEPTRTEPKVHSLQSSKEVEQADRVL